MSEPFNWRAYLVVSDALGVDKLLVEQALDRIAATGEDGESLIKAAHAKCGEAKMTIYSSHEFRDPESDEDTQKEPGSQLRTLMYETSEGRRHSSSVIVNHRELRTLYVDTPSGSKQVSAIGIVVHELFHGADPSELNDARKVKAPTLGLEQKYAIYQTYRAVLAEWMQALWENPAFRVLTEEEQLGFLYQEEKKNHNAFLAEVSERIGIPADQFDVRLGGFKSTMRKKGVPLTEYDATNYTDVFMRKHFPDEPWRGDYKNAQTVYHIDPHCVMPKPGKGEYVPNIYEPAHFCAGDLGELSQPVISKTPESKEQAPVPARK